MKAKYHNAILGEKVSPETLSLLAGSHGGVIKVVADLRRGIVAAGAKWHSKSRDLLVEDGGDAGDMWGAKLNVNTGEIKFESMINENREGARDIVIVDKKIRKQVEALIRKYLV